MHFAHIQVRHIWHWQEMVGKDHSAVSDEFLIVTLPSVMDDQVTVAQGD